MGDIGNFALIIAFALSIYTIFASVIGARKCRNDIIISAERSLVTGCVMVAVASLSIVILLLKSDFSYSYVTSYSNKDLPFFYKFAAFWAGQAGSLLFWLLILSIVSSVAVLQNKEHNRELMPYVMAAMSIVTLFFILVTLFIANPFDHWVVESETGTSLFTAGDGNGLNPLLQHWAMVIHPPALFIGYSGFLVPFAFAIAALITGKLDANWTKVTRRWTIFAWIFLGIGILLGGRWAYVELGWGGYWAWDPVENASLLPWLTGTAYLHSVIIQEKRGMLKVWNISLIIVTFLLCILGTFITRSGIISSVHSFAQSSIGPAFGSFLFFLIAGSLFLIIRRLPDLKSETRPDSLLSRESGFLFNNLILVGAMLATLWGTIIPILSEWIQGTQITVGAPYFNKVNIPIGLFLLFLTGVGPLFAWRKSSASSLKRNFLYPFSSSVVFGFFLFVLGVRHIFALISFTLCFFVAFTVLQEFFKGTHARRKNIGESYCRALINLTLRNTRRYGGYIVHFGIVFLFMGFTGNAFNKEKRAELGIGDTMEIGSYELRLDNFNSGENPLYEFIELDLAVFRNGKEVSRKTPQKRYYLASGQITTEVAIHSSFSNDLYIVYTDVPAENRAEIITYLNPLICFVWLGGGILVIGSIIAMIPNRVKNRKITIFEELAVKEEITN
ncbi:hypothetical protein AMJ80_02475 [bacterium SM23_31]|nr:MAG: hypothetical protein AMJ80_02475 [bacterium SM23_31]